MKISEACKITGLSKKAIRYYVEKGLVAPIIKENGYYDFSSENLEDLVNIQRLRSLGFSVEKIQEIFLHPSTAFYHLGKHIKELEELRMQTEVNLQALSQMIDQLETSSTAADIKRLLNENIQYYSPRAATRPIDLRDAEMLANFFWGRFERHKKRSEYEQFLLEKMEKKLILDQSEYAIKTRDMLYSLEKSQVSTAFLALDYDEEMVGRIASLGSDSIEQYVTNQIHNAQNILSDMKWVNSVKQRLEYLNISGDFFASDLVNIMYELSPLFKQYSENYKLCHEILLCKYNNNEDLGVINSIRRLLLDVFSDTPVEDQITYIIRMCLTLV